MENEQDRFYDDNNEPRQPYVKKTFDEKNYLNTRLDKGETKREVRIRILPASPDTKKIYTPIHIHSLKLDTEIAKSGFKSFICLNDEHLDHHDDRGCPICNKAKELFDEANQCEDAAQKKALLKSAYGYMPKTAYILRVVDRAHPEDGVKFWRFNKWDNGNGCLDKLKNIWKTRNQESIDAGLGGYDIFDLHNGRDIILTLSKSQNNDKTDKTEISIMDAGIQTPLASTEEEIEAFVNSPRHWSDMYSIKPYEYIEIAVNGQIPWYDKETGKYVPKAEKEESNAKMEEEIRQELQNAGTVSEPQGETAADDLPF